MLEMVFINAILLNGKKVLIADKTLSGCKSSVNCQYILIPSVAAILVQLC